MAVRLSTLLALLASIAAASLAALPLDAQTRPDEMASEAQVKPGQSPSPDSWLAELSLNEDGQVVEAMGKLLSLRQGWQEKRAFVQRGMTPGNDLTVTQLESPAQVLGELPRPGAHPYRTASFQRELDLLTSSALTAGNTARLLLNSESWDTKAALMDQAEEHLLVTAMIMRCDEGGMAFTRHMSAAAARGVDTRFILDGLFAFYAMPCLDEMRDAGVKISLSLRSLQPWTFDWEMHEKLMIVDSRYAVIGGQNVGTWYQESTGTDRFYRDTDVLLEGPIIRDIGRRFVTLWTSQQPEDKTLLPLLSTWDALDTHDTSQGLLGVENYERWLSPARPAGVCRFVAQDPHLDTFHVWTAYQAHIEAAQKRVMLTAYALDPLGSATQEGLRDALVDLASRPDARVDILTNGAGVLESDVVPSLFRRSYARSILTQAWEGLGQTPVKLWIYDHFLHAKQYYFDGLAVGIGSFNYDVSGNRCQESTVICYDAGLVDALERSFALDIANSHEVSQDGSPVEQAPAAASSVAGGPGQPSKLSP